MINDKYLAEFIGTLVFIYVIIDTAAPLAIATTLLAAILTAGKISGGHFNPAVTIAAFARGVLSKKELIPYVSSQILGGLAAVNLKNIL